MSSSTSSQVRTRSVPRTPTQGRHPHTHHSGPPKVSITLEPSPAPKVHRGLSDSAPTVLAPLPATGTGWSEAGVGFTSFRRKKKKPNKPTQPSSRVLPGGPGFFLSPPPPVNTPALTPTLVILQPETLTEPGLTSPSPQRHPRHVCAPCPTGRVSENSHPTSQTTHYAELLRGIAAQSSLTSTRAELSADTRICPHHIHPNSTLGPVPPKTRVLIPANYGVATQPQPL